MQFCSLLVRTFVFTTMLLISSAALAQTDPQSKKQTASAAETSGDQSEIEATKQDLKQMRVILNQMATNLAAVSDTQSPLKHQFQLDIEMWQVIMMRMQRRIDRLEASSSAKPNK